MSKTEFACKSCGKQTVEKTPSGLYYTACKIEIKEEKRAVHHEGFPHVVAEDEEHEY